MYYLGSSGKTLYILDSDNRKAATFSELGAFRGFVDFDSAIPATKGRLSEVYPFSILGKSVGDVCTASLMTPIIVNSVIKKNIMLSFSELDKRLRGNHVGVFRLMLTNLEPGLTQVIFLLKKGYVDEKCNGDYVRFYERLTNSI